MILLNDDGQPKELPVEYSEAQTFLKYGLKATITKNYSNNPALDELNGLEFLEFPKEFRLFHGSQSMAVTGSVWPIPGMPLPENASMKQYIDVEEQNIPLWFMGDYKYSIIYGNRPPTISKDIYNKWYEYFWYRSGEHIVPSNKVSIKNNVIEINSRQFYDGYTKIFCYKPVRNINLILINVENIKKFIRILINPKLQLPKQAVIKMVQHLFNAFFYKHRNIIDASDFWARFAEIDKFDRRSVYYSDDVEFSRMLCDLFELIQSAGFPVDGYIAPPTEMSSGGTFHPEIMICRAPHILRHDPTYPLDWRKGYNAQGILDSFRKYINNEARNCLGVHRGNLYQHSVWTFLWMNHLIQTRFPYWFEWTFKNIGFEVNSYKSALLIAAIYHDIGKGGNIQKSGKRYDDHPERGFQMLIGERNYCRYTLDGQIFDVINFDSIIDSVVNNILKLFIAVSIGMHYKLGLEVVQPYINNKGLLEKIQDSLDRYLEQMGEYVLRYSKIKDIKVDINNPEFFIPLIEFCIGVSVADVLGAQKYNESDKTYSSNIVNPPTYYDTCPQVKTFYEMQNWNDSVYAIKNALIELYYKKITNTS